jgi:hypothetical protein
MASLLAFLSCLPRWPKLGKVAVEAVSVDICAKWGSGVAWNDYYWRCF